MADLWLTLHAAGRASERFPGVNISAALRRAVRPDKATRIAIGGTLNSEIYTLWDEQTDAGFVVSRANDSVITVIRRGSRLAFSARPKKRRRSSVKGGREYG
jgi:hypothetical protein